MAGFTNLFSSIVTSTIWQEDPETKVVWITLLALADAHGRVDGTIPGIANIANVSIGNTSSAISKFLNPDKYSRNQAYEGRRLKEIDGGWQILNYTSYRRKRDPEKRKKQNREAQARYRNKPKVSQDKPQSAQAEAEAEADTNSRRCTGNVTVNGRETKIHSSTSTGRIVSAWQKLPLPPDKKAVDASCLLAIDRILSELSADTQEPIHEGMVLEAIENYGKALKLQHSQTFKHKIYPFLQRHVKKYVSYNFDIDHHDGSKFKKDEKQPQQPFQFAGHYCSQKSAGKKCTKPAAHKYVNDYGMEYYRCEEHKRAEK